MLNKIHQFFFNLLFKTFYINQQTGEVKNKEGNVIGKCDKFAKWFEQFKKK